jgi:hypothetical protein
LLKNITISVVLPSRSRPERLARLLASISSTTSDLNSIEVVVLLDADDAANYPRSKVGGLNLNFFVGEPGRTMGELNQDCVSKANGEIIFFTNDDVIFRTVGWDALLIREIGLVPDSIYLMYPNDLFKGPKLCTFPILSRRLLLENLDILPDSYLGAFMDLHIMDVFKAYRLGSRITYLKDLVCEHQHYRKDETLFDNTYEKRDRWGDDEQFIKLSSQRFEIVSRLEKLQPKSNNWLKEDSVFQLLTGSADVRWKIGLFFYMISRRLYKFVFIW